jgi:hypothetical protein
MTRPTYPEFRLAVEHFRVAINQFSDYPAGLAKGKGQIAGSAFFPGGDGLVYPRPDITPDIMIVGHDFGSLKTFDAARDGGAEDIAVKTWGRLRSLLHAAEITDERCYFTNAYIGYREQGRDDGPYPARQEVSRETSPFGKFCKALLARQIAEIRPRAIIVLGKYPARFVAQALPGAVPTWRRLMTLAEHDFAGALQRAVVVGPSLVSDLGLLAHPSRPNNWRRHYCDAAGTEYGGRAAEIALLRDLVGHV